MHFFPFLSRAAPGARPPPPPPPPSASLPGADYLSRAALRVPGMPSAPGEQAIHRGAAGAGGRRAGAARGAGGPEPSTPEVPPRAGAGGRGARREREARGRKDGSSLDLGRERARGRGEGARARRAGGSESGAVTGTATGVKGAQLQEAGRPRRRSVRAPRRDPAPPRAPPAAPAPSNPHWRPEAPGLREEEGAEGEAGSLLVLPGQAGGRKLSCKFIIRSAISVKMMGGPGRGATEPQENKGSFPSKWASSAKGTPRPQAPHPPTCRALSAVLAQLQGAELASGARGAARALR